MYIVFSQRYVLTLLPIFILRIQTTLEDFQKVLTDEQKSRKSLDASVKALTVSLCIVTDCNLHLIYLRWLLTNSMTSVVFKVEYSGSLLRMLTCLLCRLKLIS